MAPHEDSVQGPSRTAVLTAVARAVHREEPPPWVIDDYLALGLAGREGLALLLRDHGFGEITDFGPDEARSTYFPGRADVEIAGASG